MGGKSSTSAVPAASITTINPASPIKTATTTTPVTSVVTTTAPTPTITSAAPPTKDASTTSVSTEDTSKPTFYSVATSITSNADKAKSVATSAVTRWYNWSKFEQQKQDKGKELWYMRPPVTSTDISNAVTTTLTMATAKTGDDQKETSDLSNIVAIPSFQLRSTAVYSPPHGDRVLSGRREFTNTDISNFKYYLPENRLKQTVGIHTRATMYKMNTRLKQTPLLTTPLSSSRTTNSYDSTTSTGEDSYLPTFVSRGLQTDLETQPINSSATQIRYYEKQPSHIVPVSAFSNYNSTNNGFYHLAPDNPSYKPVLPPIEQTPVWSYDQPYPSVLSNPPAPPRPTSILKNSSTVLSRDISNPLPEQTHDKVLEELRKRNKNAKDGTYRVKKIHLLEKNEPATVSFNLPRPPTKASQSVSRSEKLFFSQLFNRKK